MLPDITETIVALATPGGEGGISVIRLSGTKSPEIAGKVVENGISENLENPRLMILAKLFDKKKILIDQALVVFFKAPNSYTGEDSFEFQCHGGDYIAHKLIETLVEHGARRAECGEFTMRAFLNGRIDLTAAEGILAMITSTSAPSHQKAVNLLRGGLKEKLTHIRSHLLNILADFEVLIDHPEDNQETSEIDYDLLEHVKMDIYDLALGYRETPGLESGLKLAIVGKPNVGKSSIMNCILMKRRVLVHPSPGTTRDVISEDVLLGEGRFKMFDTAGLRETMEDVEMEGIRMAKEAIDEADAVIAVLDRSKPLTDEDFEILRIVSEKPQIICLNKIDLPAAWALKDYDEFSCAKNVVQVSALKEDGIDRLLNEMKLLYTKNVGEIIKGVPLLKRHHGHLVRAAESLEQAQASIGNNLASDAIAIDLRNALEEILRITGEHYDDALLEEIFSNFCIGK